MFGDIIKGKNAKILIETTAEDFSQIPQQQQKSALPKQA
jgi:hypothetical protein